MEIKLFQDIWFDCYSAFFNNIIFTLDEKRIDRIFSNNYFYIKNEEKNIDIKTYMNLNTLSTNLEKRKESLFQFIEKKYITDKDELFECICNNLNQNNLVMLQVDMYEYLPSIKSIYHKNHIPHSAHISKYDVNTGLFTVIERTVEEIPKEKLVQACLMLEGEISIFHLKDDIVIPPVTLEEVKSNAEVIIESLDRLLDDFNLWEIHEPLQKDFDYFVSITCGSHIESIKMRNHANAKLMPYVIKDKQIEELFLEIEDAVAVLQRSIIKECIRHNWDKIIEFREELFQILMMEKDAWKKVLNKY